MAYPRGYPGNTAAEVRATLDGVANGGGLPSWLTVTRGAGSWSRQTAAAVNGTTFITLGTAQNTGRFDYDPQSGRALLLIEPTRTQCLHYSNFVDGDADHRPDTWGPGVGTVDVDFDVATGGPHGGIVTRLLSTATTDKGFGTAAYTMAGVTEYTYSIWERAVGLVGVATMRAFGNPEVQYSIAAGSHDWTRTQGTGTTVGVPAAAYLRSNTMGLGQLSLVLPQIEAAECASSYISTAAGVTAARAAELCTIDPTLVGRLSGRVSFLWRPDFASTTALTVSPVLFAWAAGYELLYDPADDKLKMMVGGVSQAETAALTFSRQALMRVGMVYSSAGTSLTVNGVTTTDTTSWGDPGVLATYLGSRAASVNCRPGAYGDLLLAAL